jgi:hypothetical protein
MHDVLRAFWTGLLTAFGALMPAAAESTDRIAFPPELRTFASPAGAYVLEVRAVDGWKLPKSKAELFSVESGDRRSLWLTALPQRYGPGTAFVSDAGDVLLIDEWMKTPSSHAVVLLRKDGEVIARYSMAEIGALAGVPGPTLVTRARVGPWMSAPPRLSAARDSVLVEAGGVSLEIDLHSGRILRGAR